MGDWLTRVAAMPTFPPPRLHLLHMVRGYILHMSTGTASTSFIKHLWQVLAGPGLYIQLCNEIRPVHICLHKPRPRQSALD